MKKIRLGLMGFGQIGRQIYQLAAHTDRFEIAVIVDVGKPEILHYLLSKEDPDSDLYVLHGNYLDNGKCNTRMMCSDQPAEVPWDVFGVDMVIDATGRFGSQTHMQAHLSNGAGRVLLSTLPVDQIDRLVLRGINEDRIQSDDRMISAGSATTMALALVLKSFLERVNIRCASMTSVHSYTSDQSLQDYAGPDYRRSRSAAENIIPNATQSPAWVEQVLPALAGKLNGYALNVPVQRGSLLDLNLVLEETEFSVDQAIEVMLQASQAQPELIGAERDPIVSSDVIGCSQSLLFDLKGTTKAGQHTFKILAWYESLGHASRLLEVAELYAGLEPVSSGRDAGGAT